LCTPLTDTATVSAGCLARDTPLDVSAIVMLP
jgi:hypothetical protein